MASWLRSTTWFQRIALLFLIVALALWVYRFAAGEDTPTSLAVVASGLAFSAFRKQLLWRVRNRLALAYFFSAVVPLFLIFWLSELSVMMLLGQFAAERVRQGLDARIATVSLVTRDLMLAEVHNAGPALLEQIRQREPRLAAIAHGNAATVMLPATGGSIATAPDWIEPGFEGLFKVDERHYLGARAAQDNADVFTYLPLDAETLATLTPGVVSVAALLSGDQQTNVGFDPSGARIAVQENGVRRAITAPQLPPPRNSWDMSIATLLPWKAKIASDKDADLMFVGLSRPSLLLEGALKGRMASVIISLLVIVGGIFLLIEIVSLALSIRHTRIITGSVHDLYQGTLRVASGDFTHPIPVRGKHQLSDLATSFNGMTTQISHFIGEMRKKEKLESELEIARQVQARLFPRTVPKLKTLEMTGVCLPGRFVSGDYYDFVPLNERYTAIALGDVSGKGVSAALLMASIQSSLHAQLKFSGAALNPSLSTATLMGLISQQLYDSTPAEKYATFFCSVYDDETGVLRYTNCGHLKPILIRNGEVSTLEGDGMVVGLLPKVSYEQQEFELQTGDLLAIFSDGIPEAENAAEKEFGEPHLGELLAKHAGDPLEKIVQTVTDAVHAWIHDPDGQDDTTIVLLRRLQSPPAGSQ